MRFVCISDVHMADDFPIPEGDVLLDAGDMTFRGEIAEIASAAKWRAGLMKTHMFKHVVAIAGNHDWLFQKMPVLARQIMADNGITYLEDSCTTIDGKGGTLMVGGCFAPGPGVVTIYGAPWQPEFNHWAFNLTRGDALKEKWDRIPREGLDILMTHGPPHNILDGALRSNVAEAWGTGESDLNFYKESVGCWDLRQAVLQAKPKLHLFGHIHAAYGRREMLGTTFINASIMNERYDPENKPHVFDLEVP